jgi:predicted ATPase
MNNIRLINFRNIGDSQQIELKPLTFFVGKNGAGKSSVLRLFPLLKQSLNEAKRGPLLWYTENGVDFGDFKTAVLKGESSIGIGFDINVSSQGRGRNTLTVLMKIEPEVTDDQYDYVSSLQISYKDVKIKIDFNQHKALVNVNGEHMGEFSYYIQSYGLFPSVFSDDREKDDTLINELFEILYPHRLMKYRGSYDFLYMSFADFSEKFSGKEIPYNLKTLFGKIVCMNLEEILNSIYMNLNNEMRSLTYIGPFRNSPQRYYRVQNKSTRMIDMYGSNMAVFVKAMTKDQLKDLNARLKPRYGFELDYESKFGQISLYIKKDKKKTNLIDNGYGYSQLMPILLALNAFNQSISLPSSLTSMLCVEQPELHLHPKMQYEFGTTLADALELSRLNNRKERKILIETHSRQIIEAVGHAIFNKQIKADDVAVYLFEQGDNKRAIIHKTEFNDEGYLINWPIGFLG